MQILAISDGFGVHWNRQGYKKRLDRLGLCCKPKEVKFTIMLHEDAKFPTTRWSQVMLAGGDRTLAQAAINGLCRVYWLPVYAFPGIRGTINLKQKI